MLESPLHEGAAETEPHWLRNLYVCAFGSFTTLLSLTMLLPFLPIYVERLGATGQASIIQWSAVAFSATFLGTALTAPIWGHLADRYGRKAMLVRAAVGMAIAMSLLGFARTPIELVLLRFIAGVVGGYASASMVMIGTQAPPSRAGWALGFLSTGSLAGALIGPLVGGFLPAWVGIRGTFFLGGALIAVAAILTIALIRESNRPASLPTPRVSPRESQTTAVPGKIIACLLATGAMVLFANMSIEPIITIYVAVLHVSAGGLTAVAGTVMAAAAVGSILTSSWLGNLVDRVGPRRVIVACLFSTAVALLPQALVHSWWQLAFMRFLMGMSVAGLLPAVAKTIRSVIPQGRVGRFLGFLQSAQYSGQVLGPLAGGAIGAHIGVRSVFVLTALVLATCGAACWRYLPRTMRGGTC